MRDPNQMSHGQYLDVAAWQRAWQREFLPFKLYMVIGGLVAALSMGTLCAGWFTMLLLDMDRETILTELTGTTYFTYWQARHSPALAAQAGAIWQGGLLSYGAWLLAWSVFPILCFRPTLKRHEILVAERDPIPLPDRTIRVPPALQRHYDLYRPYLPPTEKGTLITVGKPNTPDRLHDLNLLRMMRIANERTVRELGPLPPGGLPVQVKGKAPHLRPHWQQELIRQQEAQAALHADANGIEREESDDMNLKQMAGTALAVGALAACTPSKPVYRHNPHPQERYEITITIEDAPGPFSEMRGSTQYWVPDKSCVPETGGPMNARRSSQETWIRYPVEQVSENVYRAEMWADGIVDEDYYGLGICKWTLMQTTIFLKGKTVRFTPDLTLSELRAQQPKKFYFSKRTYESSKLEGVSDSGEESPSKFGIDVRDELFTITLMPRRTDR